MYSMNLTTASSVVGFLSDWYIYVPMVREAFGNRAFSGGRGCCCCCHYHRDDRENATCIYSTGTLTATTTIESIHITSYTARTTIITTT